MKLARINMEDKIDLFKTQQIIQKKNVFKKRSYQNSYVPVWYFWVCILFNTGSIDSQ